MRLVADANVLLAAATGGRAGLVLEREDIQVLATAFTLAEVYEYLEEVGRAKRLPLDRLLLVVAALPVHVIARDTYATQMKEAERRIAQRDPDDVDTLALALHEKAPVWSNDDDFKDTGVEWYTTAELLKRLGISGR